MKRLRTVVPMIAAGLLLASQAAAALACGECDPGGAIVAAHAVTAKYQSLNLAEKAGYSILADSAGITCIAEPQMGAMGVHYVKGDLVEDPAIDAYIRKLWSMHPTDMAGCTWPPWNSW